MSARQVASQRTTWELDALLGSLDRAWSAIVDTPLPAAGLAVLAAQATLETGRRGASCWNWNVSNIMGVSPEGLFHVLRAAPECAPRHKVPEGATILTTTNVACPPGSVAYLPPGGSRFRAYSSLELGCEDKLAVLAALWPLAVEALGSGMAVEATASAFVAGLKRPLVRGEYMTADAVSYARSVTSIAREYLSRAEAHVRELDDAGQACADEPTQPALPVPTLEAHAPVEGVVLEDFLTSLADEPSEPKT